MPGEDEGACITLQVSLYHEQLSGLDLLFNALRG